jgi:hypothetical protein
MIGVPVIHAKTISPPRPARVNPQGVLETVPELDIESLLSALDCINTPRHDHFQVTGIEMDPLDERSHLKQLFGYGNNPPSVFSRTNAKQVISGKIPTSFEDAFQYIGCPLSVSSEALVPKNREDLKFVLRHISHIIDLIDSYRIREYEHGMKFPHYGGYRDLVIYPIIKGNEVKEFKIGTHDELKRSIPEHLPGRYMGTDEIVNRYRRP